MKKRFLFVISCLFLGFFNLTGQVQFVSGIVSDKYNNSRVNNENIAEIGIDFKNFKEFHLFKAQVSPITVIGNRKWEMLTEKAENGVVRLKIDKGEPTHFHTSSLLKSQDNIWFITEPGDNVTITSDGSKLFFSGKGSEKYRLKYQIDSLIKSIVPPVKRNRNKKMSLEDYFEATAYIDKQLELVSPFIETYKDKVSTYAFNYIKAGFLDKIISQHSNKFNLLIVYAKPAQLSNSDLCAIYDSVYYPATNELFKWVSKRIYGTIRPINMKVWRQYSFNSSESPLNSEVKRHLLYYQEGYKIYNEGKLRQDFQLDFIYKEIIISLGMIRETEKILKDYYNEPGYPEYKAVMKEYEVKARQYANGKNAPDFVLKDAKDRIFEKQNLQGKVAILDFWFTGCVGCVQMTPAMKKVEDVFRNDTNVVFVNISVDTDKKKWLKSIGQKKYTTGNGVNLYTNGEGVDHDIITKYGIRSYPSLQVIDPFGRVVRVYPWPDPRKDDGKALAEVIRKHLLTIKDGPYVFNNNDSCTIYSINAGALSETKVARSDNSQLRIQTDSDKTFMTALKKELSIEPSEYSMPDRLFVLSDIEGNFDALRKLLQGNKVVDEKLDWTFGKGHLVIVGDLFDRGNQVTECLWLVYSLEEKAKKYGGHVHLILGNHEIMNLDGNDKYVELKYKDNFKLMGKDLQQVYGENSELGKWLRTKNVMEKIGDILFVHGGISDEVNRLNLSISQVNNITRAYYGKGEQARNSSDSVLNYLYSYASPFWDRHFYLGEDKHMRFSINGQVYLQSKPTVEKVDDYLKSFRVNRIITGHTIKSDTINLHYGDKIINVDTKHADGKSEALLIEGSSYYRVNQNGEKIRMSSF